MVTLVQTSARGGGMKAEQIDKVCVDWLKANYGGELAMEYGSYSLLIPM